MRDLYERFVAPGPIATTILCVNVVVACLMGVLQLAGAM